MLYTKSALFWVYLWQLKEYRLDRFWAEYGFLGKILHFWIFSGGRKFHRPVFTIKALIVYATVLLVILFGIYGVLKGFFYGVFGTLEFLIIGLIGLYILTPLIVVAIIFIFQAPIILAKYFIFRMAELRLAERKNLIVIGITGSYGKTSTKEFLAQILEQKFKVIKTPKNVNTEIGVAKFILQHFINPPQPSFQTGFACNSFGINGKGGRNEIFIVEMGAYKKGEIRRVCKIAKPEIGIITGINEQHLSLFGSFQNIIDTKYELIESLPENGLAVFNGENEYCLEIAERWSGKKAIYRKTPSFSSSPYQGGEAERLPSHYLQNFAGAVEIAKYLGMSEKEINEAMKNIKLTEQMIKTFIGKNGVLIIDDSYSANPAGVLAALDYLAKQDKKYKIIIMPCLIELGNMAEEIHKKIGKKIAEVCDLAIITTKDYFGIIKEEAKEKSFLAVTSPKAIELLKDKLNQDTTILLEGRLSQKIVEFIE